MHLLTALWTTHTLFLLLFSVGCQNAALTSAKLYLQEDEIEKAEQQLEKALREEPQNPEVHFLLGRIAASRKSYTAMDSAFAASAGLSPRFHRQIEQLRRQHWAGEHNTGTGFIASPSPNLEAARRAFANAIIIDPQPLESWRNIAYVYYRLDSLDNAIEIYTRIIAAAPADTSSLAGLGRIYLEQRRYQEAVQPLTRFLQLVPDDVKNRTNLGITYEHLGRYDEAEESYDEVLRLAPRSALVHYNLGNIYWQRMDYHAAKRAYERALALNPDDLDARYNLAVTYLELEELDRALSLLQNLSARMPDNPDVWRELGRLYALKGMVEKSRRAFSRAEALSP